MVQLLGKCDWRLVRCIAGLNESGGGWRWSVCLGTATVSLMVQHQHLAMRVLIILLILAILILRYYLMVLRITYSRSTFVLIFLFGICGGTPTSSEKLWHRLDHIWNDWILWSRLFQHFLLRRIIIIRSSGNLQRSCLSHDRVLLLNFISCLIW